VEVAFWLIDAPGIVNYAVAVVMFELVHSNSKNVLIKVFDQEHERESTKSWDLGEIKEGFRK
jgi:hypothetical protein